MKELNGYIGWIANCFPEDQELLDKIADLYLANKTRMRGLFLMINHKDRKKIEVDLPLIIAIIAKLPQNIEELSELGKENLFGLYLRELDPVKTREVMYDFLLDTLSQEAAFAAIIALVHHNALESSGAFRMLRNIYDIFRFANKGDNYANQMICFSFDLFNELKKANKYKIFIDFIKQIDDKNLNDSYTKYTFIHCHIIGVLKYLKDPIEAKNALSFLEDETNLISQLMPTKDFGNAILEDNLTMAEKKLYLEWAHGRGYMIDAAFKEIEK